MITLKKSPSKIKAFKYGKLPYWIFGSKLLRNNQNSSTLQYISPRWTSDIIIANISLLNNDMFLSN